MKIPAICAGIFMKYIDVLVSIIIMGDNNYGDNNFAAYLKIKVIG